MRILIDLQGAQSESRYRGIGRYATALGQALAKNAGEHEIWLVANAALDSSCGSMRRDFAGLVRPERIRLFDVPVPAAEMVKANAWRARAGECLREHFLRQLQPDVVLVTSLFEGYLDSAAVAIDSPALGERTAVILYDLIPYLNPADYLGAPGQKDYYARKITSLRNAGLLLAISAHARHEAIAALGFAPERIVTIGTAADPCFRPGVQPAGGIARLREQLGITRRMVLCVPGGFDVRKNLPRLIAAYRLLPDELRATHQLVIASRLADSVRANLRRAAHEAGLAADELVLTGYVSDTALAALYAAAALFVFPSLHEGFGLPVLEAMSCGAPVLAGNNSSLPEVVGRADALFDAGSPQAIADSMTAVLVDPLRREELGAHGLRQAANFSWDRVARSALDALEQRFGTMPAAAGSARNKPAAPADLIAALGALDVGKPRPGDLVQTADCLAFNRGRPGPACLFLDISEIVKSDAKTGIQRVVRGLLGELLAAPPAGLAVCPIYFDGRVYRTATRFLARMAASRLAQAGPGAGTADAADDAILDASQDDIYLALDLNGTSPAVLASQQKLRRRGIRMHFIVYDILLLQRPEWWPPGSAKLFENWLRDISSVADGLICISEAVAGDVRAWLERQRPSSDTIDPLPSVTSFHLGADIENSHPSRGLPGDASAVLERLAAAPGFLLVGTVEPRKGHAQTLAAFEQLWAAGVTARLVIVGKQGWLVDALAERLRGHAECGERLFWLEGISDDYVRSVYAACRCLIAASEGEGFGLPLVEAAHHHLPILARDIPVFREVAGAHASYFSGLSAAELASAIVAWLAADAAGTAPPSLNMPRLSWRQSARQLVGCLNLSVPMESRAS